MIRLKLQNLKISHYIFVFKFILLSIFYSLSLYHLTNVIILLDSFSHVVEMLSPLILQLELQNMKISHHVLSSNLYYKIYFIHYHFTVGCKLS